MTHPNRGRGHPRGGRTGRGNGGRHPPRERSPHNGDTTQTAITDNGIPPHSDPRFFNPAGNNTASFKIPGFDKPTPGFQTATELLAPQEENRERNNKTPADKNTTSGTKSITPENGNTAAQKQPNTATTTSSVPKEPTSTNNPSTTPTKNVGNDGEDLFDYLSPGTLEKVAAAAEADAESTPKTPIDLTDDNRKQAAKELPPRVTNPPRQPFDIPDTAYTYDASKNQETSPWAVAELNKEPDYHKAIETLEPQQQMKTKTALFRAQMQGVSLVYDNCSTNYARIDNNKSFIHRSVQIQAPTYHIPAGATNYKNNLLPLYLRVNDALAQCAETFKQEATKIIHTGHRIKRFQLKLDRINLLFRHLVNELGQFHAAVYRATNPTVTKSLFTDEDLARLAVRDLIKLMLDLETLEYLDINRTQLLEVFDASYPPKATKIYGIDAQAVNFTRNTIMLYLKACTVTHYKRAKPQKTHTTAMATVAAKMERATATAAMSSTTEALKTQAPAFPQNPKALTDLITKTITQELNKNSHKAKPSTNKLSKPTKKAAATTKANNTAKEATKKRSASPSTITPSILKKKARFHPQVKGAEKSKPSAKAPQKVPPPPANNKNNPKAGAKPTKQQPKAKKPDRRRRHSKSSTNPRKS